MANKNPVAGRQARKRRPTPGTIRQLQATLWAAILKLEATMTPAVVNILGDADATRKGFELQVGELCKLSHALAQSGSVYLRAVEVGELEARIQQLEQHVKETKK